MAICRECGFLVRGSQERCQKCGADLRPPGLEIASRRAVRSLEGALLGASVEPQAETEPEAIARPPAPLPAAPPAAPLPATPDPGRLWMQLLAGVLAAVLLAIVLKVLADRAAFPLEPGDTWTFEVLGQPRTNLTLTVAGEARGARIVRADMVADGAATTLGVAYVRKGLRGLDVIGVQRPGSPEPELESVRLLPFPYSSGSSWTERVGRDLGAERLRMNFRAGDEEKVASPNATWQALPVHFELVAPQGQPLLWGSYALARDVGPVRFSLGVPGEFQGLRKIDLRLLKFARGTG